MGIAKMSLVNIMGNQKFLDEALLRCTYSQSFHPEQATTLTEYSYSGAVSIKQENPYSAMLARTQELAQALGVDPEHDTSTPKDEADSDENQLAAYLNTIETEVFKLINKQKNFEKAIYTHMQTIKHLSHLHSMSVNFDELFSCEYLKIRFGRLPIESYNKLNFYFDKPFVFFPLDSDREYCWCLYITAQPTKEEIDALFASLFFERLRIPNYAHGTPDKAIELIQKHLDASTASLDKVKSQLKEIAAREHVKISTTYDDLKFLEHVYDLRICAKDMRKFSAIQDSDFIIIGFIPAVDEQSFAEYFVDLDEVTVTIRPAESDARLTPPVKLKNTRFAQPYEMFVSMYGMPSYKDIDPTPMVAITYTLLFGIMFGDVGQGLVIALLGWLVWKKKKMDLGRIMVRVGFSSCGFGFLYGSVFGFEELLDPLYHAIGLSGKPLHVMAPSATNLILLSAVGIGIVIILLALCMNIALGLKQKNWERAFFSHNGVAGLVFYGACIYAAVMTLGFNTPVLNPLYTSLLIALPLVIIFLKEPLAKILARKKDVFHNGVGNFIVESFFEMFEILLSFVSNTMSFLRVGGFILSHAGMMAVVFTLSSMVSSAASPFVIIIGNIFVMGLEGLIVGIQVLRLEFYEMFSRFFEGDGKAFNPIVVKAEEPSA